MRLPRAVSRLPLTFWPIGGSHPLATDDKKWVAPCYVDINGDLRGKVIPSNRLGDVLSGKIRMFTLGLGGLGSFHPRADESAMIVAPGSFRTLPWREDLGLAFAEMRLGESLDPRCFRGLLSNQVERAMEAGLWPRVGTEIEFYVETGPSDRRHGSYHLAPFLQWTPFGALLFKYLSGLQLDVAAVHTEGGLGQVEVVLGPRAAVDAGDCVVLVRLAAQQAAVRSGLKVALEPPSGEERPCSLHINISLNGASDGRTAESFAAGILTHIRALSAICLPEERGWEGRAGAPVFASADDRRAVVRLPSSRPRVIEIRAVDSTANPYLVLTSLLASGADGVKRGLTLSMETWDEARGGVYGKLPHSLRQALRELNGDDVLVAALGPELVGQYCQMKVGGA